MTGGRPPVAVGTMLMDRDDRRGRGCGKTDHFQVLE
jgi:hypothetical protein